MEQIILASGSKRRQEFLQMLDLPFITMPSDIDESLIPGLKPEEYAEEMAIRKAKKAAEGEGKGKPWILGADTIVVLNGKIYGKPEDRNHAKSILLDLQGNTHEVISAIALYNGRKNTIQKKTIFSKVSFSAMSEAEIELYLDKNEWQDAAGAYKIQGFGSCFIESIEGSYSSVIGLPLREFYVMLRGNGYQFGSEFYRVLI